jgi:hypothetical protein
VPSIEFRPSLLRGAGLALSCMALGIVPVLFGGVAMKLLGFVLIAMGLVLLYAALTHRVRFDKQSMAVRGPVRWHRFDAQSTSTDQELKLIVGSSESIQLKSSTDRAGIPLQIYSRADRMAIRAAMAELQHE